MAAEELAPWINSAGEDGDRNSMQQFDGNGTQKSFDFNFAGGYIFSTDVKAYLYDLASGLTTAVSPVVLTGPNTIFVDPAPTAVNVDRTAGQVLVVYRDTQKTVPLVDYSIGAVMDEANLDMSNKQAVFVAAEMVDRFDSINALSADAITRSFEALTKAEEALYASVDAQDAAVDAANSAEAATADASAATATANNALSVANGIDAKATTALSNSNTAVTTANTANTKADTAIATANGVDAKAQTALDNSATAVSTANTANSTANAASAAVASKADKTALSFRTGFRGLTGLSTAASTMQITSNRAWLTNASGDLLHVATGTTLSLNLTTQGAGGRDQAGNFANTWVYVFHIWNPTTSTMALIASTNSSAPTLPSGFTHYAFTMAFYCITTNTQNGGWVLTGNYLNYQFATQALYSGSIVGTTSAPHSAMTNTQIILPPLRSVLADLALIAAPGGGGAVFAVWNSSTSGRRWQYNIDGTATVNGSARVPFLPGNDFRAELNGGTAPATASLWVAGYFFPNGAN